MPPVPRLELVTCGTDRVKLQLHVAQLALFVVLWRPQDTPELHATVQRITTSVPTARIVVVQQSHPAVDLDSPVEAVAPAVLLELHDTHPQAKFHHEIVPAWEPARVAGALCDLTASLPHAPWSSAHAALQRLLLDRARATPVQRVSSLLTAEVVSVCGFECVGAAEQALEELHAAGSVFHAGLAAASSRTGPHTARLPRDPVVVLNAAWLGETIQHARAVSPADVCVDMGAHWREHGVSDGLIPHLRALLWHLGVALPVKSRDGAIANRDLLVTALPPTPPPWPAVRDGAGQVRAGAWFGMALRATLTGLFPSARLV